MASIWPWLAIAGAGALHGLNPVTGWIFAVGWGVGSREQSQALRALMPIAAGHAAAIALVAAAFAGSVMIDRVVVQSLACGLLVVAALLQLGGHRATGSRKSAGRTGLALWSFMMGSAHGAGLMLLPALGPLCIGGAPGGGITAAGSLVQALAAIGVHTAAMLAVSGVLAVGCCRAFEPLARRLRSRGRSPFTSPGLQRAAQPEPARVP